MEEETSCTDLELRRCKTTTKGIGNRLLIRSQKVSSKVNLFADKTKIGCFESTNESLGYSDVELSISM